MQLHSLKKIIQMFFVREQKLKNAQFNYFFNNKKLISEELERKSNFARKFKKKFEEVKTNEYFFENQGKKIAKSIGKFGLKNYFTQIKEVEMDDEPFFFDIEKNKIRERINIRFSPVVRLNWFLESLTKIVNEMDKDDEDIFDKRQDYKKNLINLIDRD